MNWIKIFANDTDARSRLTHDRPQLLIVNGQRICLVLHDNAFLAVQDACTHNSESLSGGQVNHLGEIICPWHNYRFNLRSGKALDSSCRDLKTYPVKSDDSGFFIGL